MRGSVVIVLLLAGCAGTDPASPDAAGTTAPGPSLPSFDPVPAPEWESGYTFTYAISDRFAMAYTVTVDGELVEQDAYSEEDAGPPLITEEVISTMLTAGGAPVYLTLDELEDWGTLLAAYRQSDLANIPVEYYGDLWFGDAVPFLRFPLTNGQSWTDTTAADTEMMGLAMRADSRIIGMEPMAGHDAVRIETTVSVVDASGMERDLEEDMKDAGVEDADVTIRMTGSQVAHYAASARNLVSIMLDMDLAMTMTGTSYGSVIEMDMQFEAEMEITLRDATFVAGPDRDKEQILAYLKDEAPALPAVPDIEVVGPATVNAAAGEETTFSLKEVPAGYGIGWTVSDATGVIATGEGAPFTHTFTHTGPHTVVAEARAGSVVGRDVLAVDVVFDGTIHAACPPLAVGATLPCDAATIAIGPGSPALTVTAEPEGLGLGGTLVLTAPDGTQMEDAASVTVDAPAAGDWTAQWLPTADALAAVDYVVLVPGGEGGPGTELARSLPWRLLEGPLGDALRMGPAAAGLV